jgi:hypothetical protein
MIDAEFEDLAHYGSRLLVALRYAAGKLRSQPVAKRDGNEPEYLYRCKLVQNLGLTVCGPWFVGPDRLLGDAT